MSSSLSYVVFAIFTGLVAEDWCQWSLAVNISLDCLPDNLMKGRDWSSHSENVNLCLSSNKSFLMTQNENILFCLGNDTDSLWFEITLISCQIWSIVKNWNHHSFSFSLSGFNTIQRRYEYFSFLSLISYSQLPVSNWRRERERERDDLTQSPTFFFHLSFCLLVLAYQLSLSLSHTHTRRLAAEDNSFHNVWRFIPSYFVFLFMIEQKNVEPSQSIHFL